MTTIKDENPFPKFPPKATNGERYTTAMTITDNMAPFYFERLVEWQMEQGGYSREEAERIERINLGYWAGYFDNPTRAHVEKVFGAAHPVFGSVRPDPNVAYAAGQRRMRKDLDS